MKKTDQHREESMKTGKSKSNAHREGKFAWQCYLTPPQNDIVTKAKLKMDCKSNRQLIVALSRNFIANPNHYASED